MEGGGDGGGDGGGGSRSVLAAPLAVNKEVLRAALSVVARRFSTLTGERLDDPNTLFLAVTEAEASVLKVRNACADFVFWLRWGTLNARVAPVCLSSCVY